MRDRSPAELFELDNEIAHIIDERGQVHKSFTIVLKEGSTIQRTASHADRVPASAAPPASDLREVNRWQPIETAPKDGTDILLAGRIPEGWRVTEGHWTTAEECRVHIGDCGGECRCPEYEYEDPSWISWDGGFCEPWPATHWMPLPAPPLQKESK